MIKRETKSKNLKELRIDYLKALVEIQSGREKNLKKAKMIKKEIARKLTLKEDGK
jgi:ribosomal protein L29